jgi:hypothetical protein
MLLSDDCCRRKINQLIGVFELSKGKNVSDNFEGLQAQKLGQVFDHYVIGQENSPARRSRL